MTQDVQLFHATVRDNLTFFDRTISTSGSWPPFERPRPATRRARVGLDTMLAPGGGSLSAGEAQLLAFARVFLKDPGAGHWTKPPPASMPPPSARLERAVDRLLAGGPPS